MTSQPSGKEIRYDRQLRLWGDNGQRKLEETRVCLLNATTVGSEILKSLILPGIGSFTIIDHRDVTEIDVDVDFFLDVTKIGCGKAETVCNYLKELNPDVNGNFVKSDVSRLVDNNLSLLDDFNIVIGTDLCEKTAIELSDYLWERRVPFFLCKCYGLIGYLRLCVPEHFVIESHPDNPSPNFVLDQPFSSLKNYVDSFDLPSLNHVKHSHVPYLILLFKALEKWRKDKNLAEHIFPQTYKQKVEMRDVLKSMRMPDDKGNIDEENFQEAINSVTRAFVPSTIPSTCKKIFSKSQCDELSMTSESFWIIGNAVKQFVEVEGALPLRGDLPDMTADSESYLKLQNIYYEKSEEDAKKVYRYVSDNLNKVGLSTNAISFDETRTYCKNFSSMNVINGHPLSAEFKGESKYLRQLHDSGVDDVPLIKWYVVLRAAESFYSQKARYPGTNGIPIELDKNDLKCRVEIFLKTHSLPTANMDNEIEEMCRYGASEIHGVAALVGGIAAHEVIKLVTNQYVPLTNTLIFDSNTGNAGVFDL